MRIEMIAAVVFLLASAGASVAESSPTGGRILATSGATLIEGGGGGGVVPWAVIAGYGERDQWGATASATVVDTDDYRLNSAAVAFGWNNRVEVSIAKQRFELPTLASALSLPTDRFRQDIVGVKVRLTGDLIYTDWPQISLGVQHKKQRDFLVPSLVGARDDSDVDVYLAASKLFLGGVGGRNVLLNGTLRSTRANQTGLLGFGGDAKSGRSLVAEITAAVLLDRHWAIGYEFRQKPDNLGFAREDDWQDLFVAWFPNKHVALVAAYADLGSIATLDSQAGWYLSLQVSL